MSGPLMRVAFLFPKDSDVRYLEQLPSRGEHVRGHGGEFFVVSGVSEDAEGYVASCVSVEEYARDARTLAREMREATRHAVARSRELVQRVRERREQGRVSGFR